MFQKRIVITLALAAAFVVPMMGQTTTTGDAPVPIADFTDPAAACQSITVVTGPASISDINVELEADHTWVGDLTVELTRDPGGTPTTLTLMNRPGRKVSSGGDTSNIRSADPVFYMDAPAVVSAEDMGSAGDAPPGGGDFVCDFDGICDFISAPDAPIGGFGTDLSDFNGMDALVTWELCIGDSAGGGHRDSDFLEHRFRHNACGVADLRD